MPPTYLSALRHATSHPLDAPRLGAALPAECIPPDGERVVQETLLRSPAWRALFSGVGRPPLPDDDPARLVLPAPLRSGLRKGEIWGGEMAAAADAADALGARLACLDIPLSARAALPPIPLLERAAGIPATVQARAADEMKLDRSDT